MFYALFLSFFRPSFSFILNPNRAIYYKEFYKKQKKTSQIFMIFLGKKKVCNRRRIQIKKTVYG